MVVFDYAKVDIWKQVLPFNGGLIMSAQFLTIRQTAEALNVSYMMVFRKISEKEFPSIRLGRKILVPATFIDNLITNAMSGTKTPASVKV